MAAANNSILYHPMGFNMKLAGISSKTSSRWHSSANENNGAVTLYRPAVKALCLYCCDGHAYYNNVDPPTQTDAEYSAAVGAIKGASGVLYVAEYRTVGQKHLAVFDVAKKEFLFAGTSEDGGVTYHPYVLNYKEGRNGTVLWLALIPYLAASSAELGAILKKSDSIRQNFRDFCFGNLLSVSTPTESQFFLFSDYAYYALGRTPLKVPEIELHLPPETKSGKERSVTFPCPPDAVQSGAYKPEKVLSGCFSLLGLTENASVAPPAAKIPTKDEFKCMYALDPTVDPSSVEDIPDWYILSERDVKIARLVKCGLEDTTIADSMKPRNLLFFGPPGTGKTETAKAVASAWGLPVAVIHGSANTSEEDIIGRFQPTEPDDKELDIEELLDTADFAPDQAYFDLTGKEKGNATKADVVRAYGALCAAHGGDGINIRYQKSPAIGVIEHGGVLIFEEPTNVRDSAVLTILNGLMDGYASIQLGNGKIISRHPHCIVIFAANVDEQQTGELQTSTLSRLHQKFCFDAPNAAEMMSRVCALTGFNDISDLTIMVNVGELIRKHIADNALVGVCGVREIADWAAATKIERVYNPNTHIRETATYTIAPSASPHKDDRDEILAILDNELNSI